MSLSTVERDGREENIAFPRLSWNNNAGKLFWHSFSQAIMIPHTTASVYIHTNRVDKVVSPLVRNYFIDSDDTIASCLHSAICQQQNIAASGQAQRVEKENSICWIKHGYGFAYCFVCLCIPSDLPTLHDNEQDSLAVITVCYIPTGWSTWVTAWIFSQCAAVFNPYLTHIEPIYNPYFTHI